MLLCPTASAPPTVPPGREGDELAPLGEGGVELVDGRARPQLTVISSGAIHSMPAGARTTVAPATGPPRVAEPGHGDRSRPARTAAAKVAQTHAPAGTACTSAQRLPAGSTLCGLATPSGSKAARSRAWRSRSVAAEQQRHEVALLQPDAVLARQHAAGGHAHPHDLVAGGVHPLEHARLALVEHEQRMEVAVAGVEDVHHDQLVAVGDLVHLPQHLAQPRPGHDGVVQVVVRLDAGDGAERALAALPDEGPLDVVGRHPHRAGAVGPADRGHPLDGGGHAGRAGRRPRR